MSDGLHTDSWVRIGGDVGVYFKGHDGGWYMSDSTWNKVHNNKSIVTEGTIQGGSFNATSDLTLKTNISELGTPLEKVLNIEGRNYTRKSVETQRIHSGFIAQQVESVIPEPVITSTSDENNIKTINYNGIIPYSVESIKEQ
jgi:hypothetical protein